MDGPNEIGDWKKILDLGSGAFGIVSLWKNSVNSDYIGKDLHFLINYVLLFYIFCSYKKMQV